MMFKTEESRLTRRFNGETLIVEPWGENALRVRAYPMGPCETRDFALEEPRHCEAAITISDSGTKIVNGKITCEVLPSGKVVFTNQRGELLLEEFARNRRDLFSKDCSALEVEGREFRPHLGGDYQITARFESNAGEKLYGMGQYQQPYLNLKGCKLELAHRNSQASVPFLLSSLGYGFLWNNPAIGEVCFGKNSTEWRAFSSKVLDYWITAGDTPAEIHRQYTAVTGRPPMMPEYGIGFWQCKLRYRTQEELLEVAREHKRRGLPMDVIVIDFFHWPFQGEWKFDLNYFPDPDAMIKELDSMGIALMVSVWPTVDKQSENYEEMHRRGLLVHVDRGVPTTMEFSGATVFFDATNPESQAFVWEKAKKNYYAKGVKLFWLDEAEPEYSVYDFDNYRYHMGSNAQIGNVYPVMYAKAFFDGMKAEGQENIVNLLRCAWAGSQKYGALVWSGDIASSFASMRNQLTAGLQMGLAGIPWWTTDIGGFHGGDVRDPAFHELLIRWFQWGTFCPVMRLHGDREPHLPKLNPHNPQEFPSGAGNEVWSYGEEVYEILKRHLLLRESLRPYIRDQMRRTHETGEPIMRPLFFDFPEDDVTWQVEDQYMFGPDYLVAPILEAGQRERKVYLPKGAEWRNMSDEQVVCGGQWLTASAPLDVMPVFVRV